MIHHDTISARLVSEADAAAGVGNFDVIEDSAGSFSVVEGAVSRYIVTDVTRDQAYAVAQRHADGMDSELRQFRKEIRLAKRAAKAVKKLDLKSAKRTMLDVSTAHLSAEDCRLLSYPAPLVRGIPRRMSHLYGWTVFVEGGQDVTRANETALNLAKNGYSETFIRLYLATCATDAILINFDADSSTVEGLTVYER